jgi:ubiquinone/menaquinone biosynthesis C-methylase UbiE
LECILLTLRVENSLGLKLKKDFISFYRENQRIKMEKQKLNLKDLVKEKYGEIANQSKAANETSCCGVGSSCCGVDYTIFSESYDKLQGYNPDADLGLGCGLPTEFAGIKQSDIVLDLGSGAGNDCFVARKLVGDKGFVYGLDFTDEMINKANSNKQKLGLSNLEFIKGDIEEMPFESDKFDVIISNCVLNLVPDKQKAFAEMHRVLKSGAHFCVSDVVIKGVLPNRLQQDAEMYAGCVSGAIAIDEYLEIIRKNNFRDIIFHKQKVIDIPNDILAKYMNNEEIKDFNSGKTGIFSITVSAKKYI